MFAIFEACGKQYKVSEGDIVFMEKLPAQANETVTFDKVLMADKDGSLKVGAPYIGGAAVTAVVVKNGKGKKIYVIRYKAKKNEKKKIGHRQPYTKVQIQSINL